MPATVKVLIPTPLQRLTQNQGEVTAEADTIRELVDCLDAQFSGFKERVCDEQGKLRRFVNVYVNEEDIRFQNNEDTQLVAGAEVSFIPAIAGG